METQLHEGFGQGLVKGLAVTLRTMLHRSVTVQYPHVQPDLPARSRGVIALKQENCTVCYKCSRECPDWCIYIDAHKETHEKERLEEWTYTVLPPPALEEGAEAPDEVAS